MAFCDRLVAHHAEVGGASWGWMNFEFEFEFELTRVRVGEIG